MGIRSSAYCTTKTLCYCTLNGVMVPCRAHMAKTCPITEKSSQVGGRYSNRTRATQFNPCGKTRRKANLVKSRIFVPETGETVSGTFSTKALKTIAKNGAYKTLKAAGLLKKAGK
jgi:large subunit ribosomal protein L28